MNNLLSQSEFKIGVPVTGIGEYGTSTDAANNFSGALSMIVGVLTLVAGIWFIFLLITGGIAWMSSGGDKGKLASARQRMMHGAIGLAIVVAALFLTEIFGGLIGLDSILDIAGMITTISQ